MIAEFLELLNAIDLDLTGLEVAEVIWLADHLQPSAPAPKPPAPRPKPAPIVEPPDPAARRKPLVAEPRRQTLPSGTAPTQTPMPEPAKADLYPLQAGTAGADAKGAQASPFRSPAAFAMPGALPLGRALRPLMRRIPSRSRRVLDEGATAQSIADSYHLARIGAWLPILKPAAERWLDIALVVDESPSMVLWERTIAEFARLLERQGAFRQVSLWGVRPTDDRTRVEFYAGVGAAADRSRPRRPSELMDHLGNRLVLMISDCISPIWNSADMARFIAQWGNTGLLALVQVLAPTLWVRTRLRTFPSVYLRSVQPGTPNRCLEVNWLNRKPDRPTTDWVPLPVFSLEPGMVVQWARSLAGNSSVWIPGVMVAPPRAPARPDDHVAAPSSGIRPVEAARESTEQLVDGFYSSASPMARRLAGYLSAVPLTLPIMRLVQRVMLPTSLQVHLAEIFLSKLIQRQSSGSESGRDSLYFDFVAGARDRLLNNVRISETIDVLLEISDHVNKQSGQALDFAALLADPTATGSLKIADRQQQRFAQVAAQALRRFGGRYARLASRLETTLQVARTEPLPQPAPTPPEPIRRTTTIHAVLIGIDRYDPRTKNLQALSGCKNDVRATESVLRSLFAAHRTNLHVLLNDHATRAAVKQLFDKLASQVKTGDQVFFLFSGHAAQERSVDADEPDGFDETLVLYDSRTEGVSDLTIRELIEWIVPLETRGAQVIFFLDAAHAGSGLFSRRPAGNLLVLAACRENELSHEFASDQQLSYGAATYYLVDALKNAGLETTWQDIYDYVLASVVPRFPEQTPQLIGPGHLTVLGGAQKPRSPRLVVLDPLENRPLSRIHAHAALGLQPGAQLEIRATQAADSSILATVVSAEPDQVVVKSASALAPGASVYLHSFGRKQRRLRVAWAGIPPLASPLLEIGRKEALSDYRVHREKDRYVVEDHDKQMILEEATSADHSISEVASKIKKLLEHLALFRRVLGTQNGSADNPLSGMVTLTSSLERNRAGELVVAAGQSALFSLRNHANVALHVSVWQLTARLGVRRIFPALSDCILLGAGREINLPVLINLAKAGQQKMVLKVFATAGPANLDVMHLSDVDSAVTVLGNPFHDGMDVPEAKSTSKRRKFKADVDSDVWFLQVKSRKGQKKYTTAQLQKMLKNGVIKSGAKVRKGEKEDFRVIETFPEFAAKQTEAPGKNERPWSPGGSGVVKRLMWSPGQILRVRFLGGAPTLLDKITRVAAEWAAHANIRFENTDDADADIRISFAKGGTWSFTGSDCRNVPTVQATMNFGWLDANSPENEIRRVVLREFGCALGLILALNSPVANFPWNRNAVYADLTAPPNRFSIEEIDRYMFHQYRVDEVIAGPADPQSIMHDAVQNRWLAEPMDAIGVNTELSAGDKAFIAQIYPYPSQPEGAPVWR